MKTIINRTILILILAIMGQISRAQSVKRVEIPVPSNSTEVFTIPLNQQGVIVLNQINKTNYTLTRYDTNLDRLWTVNGTMDASLDYVKHSYDGKNLYLLFSRYRSNVLKW